MVIFHASCSLQKFSNICVGLFWQVLDSSWKRPTWLLSDTKFWTVLNTFGASVTGLGRDVLLFGRFWWLSQNKFHSKSSQSSWQLSKTTWFFDLQENLQGCNCAVYFLVWLNYKFLVVLIHKLLILLSSRNSQKPKTGQEEFTGPLLLLGSQILKQNYGYFFPKFGPVFWRSNLATLSDDRSW